MNIPYSLVFSWELKRGNESDSMMILNKKLSEIAINTKPLEWEVVIILKRSKRKNIMSDGSEFSKKNKDDAASILFVRLADCSKCCVIPKMKRKDSIMDSPSIMLKDILVGDENLEEILTNSAELATRSTWRIIGLKYCVGDFMIAVGSKDHGTDVPEPILEISYLPSCNNFYHLTPLMEDIVHDLISDVCVNIDTIKRYDIFGIDSNENSFTIAHRAFEWSQIISDN